MTTFAILLKKELLVELRTKEVTVTMFTFGLAVVITFALAFNVSPDLFQTFAPGLFWVMIMFAAVLGLHRVYAYEKDFDAFSLLIGSPLDRGLIFLAKWVSGILLLGLMEILIIIPFFLFLHLAVPPDWVTGLGLILLGNTAIMAIGSLVSGLAMRARLSEVLLPVLVLPLVSPVLIAAVKATTGILEEQPYSEYQVWLQIILTFSVVFGLLGYTLFDHITEE